MELTKAQKETVETWISDGVTLADIQTKLAGELNLNLTYMEVRFLVDAALMKHDPVNFHPLTNTGTTVISRADFEKFVRATGHGFEVVDFTQLLTE